MDIIPSIYNNFIIIVLFKLFYKVTKNNKWSTSTLDCIHCLVVDKNFKMTVNLDISNGNIYAVSLLI